MKNMITIANIINGTGLKYWRIYEAIRSGELKSYRQGNEYYVDRKDLGNWKMKAVQYVPKGMQRITDLANELATTVPLLRWIVKKNKVAHTKVYGKLYVDREVVIGLYYDSRSPKGSTSFNEICRKYGCTNFIAKKVLGDMHATRVANRLFYNENEVKEAFDAYQR